MTEKLVVIGAGMASGRMLEHLFDANPDAYDVTLFNAEPRGNYNRLMLSPVLSGDKTYDEIVTHDDDWYAANGVTCRFGERVLGIDRERKMVVGEKGEVAYDKLVFGTGSNPFIIPLPGHDLDGVIPYRDLEDTEAMMQLGDKPGVLRERDVGPDADRHDQEVAGQFRPVIEHQGLHPAVLADDLFRVRLTENGDALVRE